MKLVLMRDGVKREIDGPFDICASKADLLRLREQIDARLTDSFVFGWFTIYPQPKSSEPNTPPLKWTE